MLVWRVWNGWEAGASEREEEVDVEVDLGLGSQRTRTTRSRCRGPAREAKTFLVTRSELASWPAMLEGKADDNRLGVAAAVVRGVEKRKRG